MHVEGVPIDFDGFSVFVIFFAFVSDEDEAGVPEVDGFDVSDGDDGTFHHIEDGCTFFGAEVDAGVPRLVGSDGVPTAVTRFDVCVIAFEEFVEDLTACGIEVSAFVAFADEDGEAVTFPFDAGEDAEPVESGAWIPFICGAMVVSEEAFEGGGIAEESVDDIAVFGDGREAVCGQSWERDPIGFALNFDGGDECFDEGDDGFVLWFGVSEHGFDGAVDFTLIDFAHAGGGVIVSEFGVDGVIHVDGDAHGVVIAGCPCGMVAVHELVECAIVIDDEMR